MKKGSVKKRRQKYYLTINQDAQLSKIYHLLNMYLYILSSNSCEDRES